MKVEVKKPNEASRDLIFLDDRAQAYLDRNPFSNCQNWSISLFCNIVDYVIYKDRLKDLQNILLDIRKAARTDKEIIVVDIAKKTFERVQEHLKFLATMPYTNLTNHPMVLCLIDLRRETEQL